MRSIELITGIFVVNGGPMQGVLVDTDFKIEGEEQPRQLIVARSWSRKKSHIVFVALPPDATFTPLESVPDADVVQIATKYLADKAEKEARRAGTAD